MEYQARRATPGQIAAAHRRRQRQIDKAARRNTRTAQRRRATIGSVIGWTVMSLFTAAYIAVAFGWLAGIDRWDFWG